MATVAMLNSQENLNRIFSELKSRYKEKQIIPIITRILTYSNCHRHEDKRIKAADELRETVKDAEKDKHIKLHCSHFFFFFLIIGSNCI